MAAVCALEAFKEALRRSRSNRATLMEMDRRPSSPAMERGAKQFAKAPRFPSSARASRIGTRFKVPTCIIPGNDKTHNHAVAQADHA